MKTVGTILYRYEKIKSALFPIIPVLIYNEPYKVNASALIDSGATISIFKNDIAKSLGIVISKGEYVSLEGVGGRIRGYIHYLTVEVAGKKFNCPIVFSNEYFVSVNLFGRTTFFENFMITFDEKHKSVELK